jgi:hypothetical protein
VFQIAPHRRFHCRERGMRNRGPGEIEAGREKQRDPVEPGTEPMYQWEGRVWMDRGRVRIRGRSWRMGTNEGLGQLTTCIHVLVTASKNAVCQSIHPPLETLVWWTSLKEGHERGHFHVGGGLVELMRRQCECSLRPLARLEMHQRLGAATGALTSRCRPIDPRLDRCRCIVVYG